MREKDMLAYCDYIAHSIFNNAFTDNRIIESIDSPRWDLHPEGGYMVSTTKTIKAQDVNGKRYKITVEEITDGE